MVAIEASSTPPWITSVFAMLPSAAALPTLKVPELRVTDFPAPPKVFTPVRLSAPAPDLVRLNAPLTIPPMVSGFALTVTARSETPSVTGVVPKFSGLAPRKVKSAFHCCAVV